MLSFSAPLWIGCTPRSWQIEAHRIAVEHLGQAEPEPAVISAIMGGGKSILLAELSANVCQGDDVVVVSTSTEMLVEDLYGAIRKRCGSAKVVGRWYGRAKHLGNIVVTCIPSVPALAQRLKEVGQRCCLWIADECHRTECNTILEDYENLAPAHALGMTATAFRSDKFEAISLFSKLLYRYGVAQAQADGVVVPWQIVHDREGGKLDEACLRMVGDAQGPGLANASNIKDAEDFAEFLTANGMPAGAIHSQMHPRKRKAVLDDLQSGRIRCAVHVNLLTEGANYPWLRWLLLRRQVDSRVRFIQEVGRLLRSHPGKSHATFFDPHDLFGSFHLAYAEALGEAPEKPEWEDPAEDLERAARAIREEPDPAVALAWVESCIRTLVVAADSSGLTLGRKPIKKLDRIKPSTPLQGAAVAIAIDRAGGLIPAGWRGVFNAILDRPALTRYGFAADLLAALEGIVRGNRWPPVDGEGRIAAMPGEESAPLSEYPHFVGADGQMMVDFARV